MDNEAMDNEQWMNEATGPMVFGQMRLLNTLLVKDDNNVCECVFVCVNEEDNDWCNDH